MKKVFLEALPRKGKRIDWETCAGYSVRFIYDDIEGEIKIISYDKISRKICVVYNDGCSKYISTSDFKGCHIGGIVTSMKEHKYNIGQIINGLEIIQQIRRRKTNEYTEKGYVVRCMIDGYEYETGEGSLTKGCGCPVCAGAKVMVGVNDIATTRPDLVKYFKTKDDCNRYSQRSNKRTDFVCPYCGNLKISKILDISYYGFSCNACGDGFSYPNKFMFSLLKQLNLEFETEFSPEWANGKRYDFYVPSKKLIIEMDGNFHYEKNKMNGNTRYETLLIDNEKDYIAKKNGLNIIRVDCNYKIEKFNYICASIINSDIPKIFNLGVVDFTVCHEYGLISSVKEVCYLWETKNFNSTRSLSEYIGISSSTITRYLKEGAALGWCSYDVKEEAGKGRIRGACSKKNKNNKESNFQNVTHKTINICNLWDESNLTTSEISEIVNMSQSSVLQHLKLGANVGICTYTKEESLKNKSKVCSEKKKNAITERAKEVCTLWDSGIHSTIEISEIVNMSRECVLKNLKKGASLGLCGYNKVDADKYSKEKNMESRQQNCKEIRVIGYDEIYSSAKELCLVSKDIFGVQFRLNNIYQVCLGEKNSHMGYKFEYIG